MVLGVVVVGLCSWRQHPSAVVQRGGAAVAESVALLAPDQQILVLTSLQGPSPPVIGGGPLIPGAARVTTRLSNKFGESEPVVQCRPGESERAI